MKTLYDTDDLRFVIVAKLEIQNSNKYGRIPLSFKVVWCQSADALVANFVPSATNRLTRKRGINQYEALLLFLSTTDVCKRYVLI
jgi:hypothetical protein